MDRNKKYGLLRLRLQQILEVFDCYGMGIYIPEVKEQIVKEVKKLDNEEQK